MLGRIGVVIAAVGLAAFGGPALAQSYSPQQEQACTPDAMRLCSAFIPDVPRITACMHQRRAELSPPCAVYFNPPPAAAHRPPVRPQAKAAKKKPAAVHSPAKKPAKPAKPARSGRAG